MKTELRILSWNIHKGIGGHDRKYNLERTISVLRHYAADILLLQEVAQGIPRTAHHDQAVLLTNALGYHAAYAPEHQFKVGGYGNLVLSRWHIAKQSHVDLTVGWRKRRGAQQCHILVPTSEATHQPLVVHNLHLGLAGSERGLQLQRLLASSMFHSIHRSTPTLIAGDLNDLWGSLGPKYLVPAGFTRAGMLRNTFPALLPLRLLDGLFHRGAVHVKHADVGRTKESRSASDHLPLYADIELHFDDV